MSGVTPNYSQTKTSSYALSKAKSPDSDISPRTQDPATSAPVDYFSTGTAADSPARVPSESVFAKTDGLKPDSLPPLEGASTGASTTSVSYTSEDVPNDSQRASQSGSDRPTTGSRKSSIASVTFRQPRNPSLPQGQPRKTDNRRLRESSPSPIR